MELIFCPQTFPPAASISIRQHRYSQDFLSQKTSPFFVSPATYNPAASSMGTPIEVDLQPLLPICTATTLLEACITFHLDSAILSHFPHPHLLPTHLNFSHPVAKMNLQTINYNTSLSRITPFYDFPFLLE